MNLIIAILMLTSISAAQAPPTTLPNQKPTLRRDRTQRVLYPKILRYEDERTAANELLEMLNMSHGGVRRRAIIALGHIGYASAVLPLIDVLNNDRSPKMRALAAFSLGEIESQYAAVSLLDRLQGANESDPGVRARAAEALGKIASNKISMDALGKYGVGGIANALVRLLPPAGEPVSQDTKFIASMALTALLRIKQSSAVEAIAAQLRSPDADLRWQAANALARIREGISVAVPVLLTLTSDREPLVRMHAARALGAAKDSRAIAPLTQLLADPDQRVVANAINSIGAIKDTAAVPALIALGNSQLALYRTFDREKQGIPPQQNLLLLIATALGDIKDARALPFLKSLRLIDGHAGSSPEVEIAIAKYGEDTFYDAPEEAGLPRGDWRAVAAYAQGLGELKTARARQELLALLGAKPDPRAVPDILNALAQSKVEGLRDILLDQLKAGDIIVRTTSATLLGDLGDESGEVTGALEAAYKTARADRMNDARIAILEAANKLKHPMNIQVLSSQTRDEDYVVRLRASELLRLSDERPSGVLQIGAVETGHDREYYRRVALLAGAAKNPHVIMRTSKGEVRIELFASDAPMTVDNFIQLSRQGFYNGLEFMRVVPSFVIQGGDPRGDMNGGPGYQIRDEINTHPYLTGTVGMALSGKDTGGSQFFITHSPQPHLDGGYTVFGQVVEGMDAVNRMARGDRIESIEIIEPK